LFLSDKLTPLAFETQPKLLSVNLTNNLITDIQKGTFVNMTRLVRLILTRNRIKRIEDTVLSGELIKKRQEVKSNLIIDLFYNNQI